MARSALQILRAVTGELGFVQPSTVFSSTDNTVVQLRELLVSACDELADEYDWQRLIKTATITTVAGQTEYDLPSDLLRQLPSTAWNRSSMWPVTGSVNPQHWEYLQSGTAAAAPLHTFRIAGNKLVVFPAPADGETLAYQYISNAYVIDPSSSDLKQTFEQDADATIFHDRCLINFLKLKFLQVKGLDTRAAVEDFNASLEAAKGGDTPARVLSMAPSDVTDIVLSGYGHELHDVRVG